MRMPCLRGAIAAICFGGVALAQGPATRDAVEARMEQFERRLSEMESRFRAELKARDDEIARLRSLVPASQPARPADDIERTRQAALRNLDRPVDSPLTLRTPASLNPNLAVISDFLANVSSDRANDARNRMDLREVELDLRAAVDPRADGVLVLAVERDVENPLFGGEPAEGPETSVSLEEGYLFLHDFGVPNLTAKLGRYQVRFGRQNILHTHDLPLSDPPFVNQVFLAPESLSDSGLSLSYVIPNPWNQYLEAIVEINAGEGAASEAPLLRGDVSVDSPSINTHLLWNRDLGRQWNMELGGSWLTGHADPDNRRDLNLFGVDLTLIRTDPTGRFNNQLFQAEAIYGVVDQPDGGTSRAWGAYLLAQQQLHKDWYFGLRLDWTQDPNNSDREIWGISPYVSWYWSEFLRFRVQYQHRNGDAGRENVLYLQATWTFGAHPPHPYWSMR